MSLRHAILVALGDTEGTGYELATKFDRTLGFFWKATHQQIYQELAKLHAAGHVSFKVVRQKDKPEKKVYRRTAKGQKALARWLQEPAAATPLRDALLVKLFAGQLVAPQVLLSEFERYHDDHERLLAKYREIEGQLFARPERLPVPRRYPQLTLRRGILAEECCLRWADEVIRFLRQQVRADSGTR